MDKAGGQIAADTAFKPLIDVEMAMATFTDDWLHCDQLSNYVARMVGHNLNDPVRYSNFLSAALNEILELSFRSGSAGRSGNASRSGKAGDKFRCQVYRNDNAQRIEVSFPCDLEQQGRYLQAISDLQGAEAQATYLQAVYGEQQPSDGTTLLGLAIHYHAAIAFRASSFEKGTLVVDFPLEGLLN